MKENYSAMCENILDNLNGKKKWEDKFEKFFLFNDNFNSRYFNWISPRLSIV